jgi:bifunctional enzyme CysN/CysC
MSRAVAQPENVGRDLRWGSKRLEGATVWITGLSGSGKSTVASGLTEALARDGRGVCVLDADNLRLGLNRDLDLSEAGRVENVRRIGEVAVLMAEAGLVTVVPIISPYRVGRRAVREAHQMRGLRFIEVHMDVALATCEIRDPKGLYKRARAGEIAGMTGIDAPYERPERAEVVISEMVGIEEAVGLISARL